MKLGSSIALLLFFHLPTITLAFYHVAHPSRQRHPATGGLCRRLHLSTVAAGENDSAPTVVLSTMKKQSKVLSVGLEYSGTKLSTSEISILSMQLRKSKVSAIFSQDIETVRELATEQQSALGNFPGPCLVVFNGPSSQAQDAFDEGASAVVLPASSIDTELTFNGEIIWKVESARDIQAVLEHSAGSATVFLVDVDESGLPSFVEGIPTKGFLVIAALDAMQPDGNEISIAKQCKTQGCGSILVRNACVGDAEDVDYAQFCVGGVTSKASSEFKFSGLTGSTNGHFGGIQSNSSIKWRRPSL